MEDREGENAAKDQREFGKTSPAAACGRPHTQSLIPIAFRHGNRRLSKPKKRVVDASQHF
jgi:hypothetical protein